MKRHYSILFLILFPLLSQAQERNTIKTIKIEVLKPLTWVGKGGYVFEPQFAIHHKNIAYSITLGHSDINDELLDQYKYNNRGMYGQLGLQFRLNSGANELTGVYFGASGNIASYEESGTVVFEGDFYDDYHSFISQKNTTFGLNWLLSAKFNLNDHFFSDLTLRFSQVLNEVDEPNHPVYYIPGLGLIIRPEKRAGLGSSIGFSIKFGYIL